MFRKIIIGGVIGLAALTVMLIPSPVRAASATFSQRILPMDCVFQIVNDGTGTLYYVTPEACGVIVGPQPTPGTTPSAAGSTGVTPGTNNAFYPSQTSGVVDLGQLPVSDDNKLTIDAEIGITYTFTIGKYDPTNPTKLLGTEKHSLTIVSIDLSDRWHPTIIAILHSSPKTLNIAQNQIIATDVDNDNDLEIRIKANYIQANKVNLSLWQTEPSLNAATVSPQQARRNSLRLWSIVAVVLVALAVYEMLRRRSVHRLLRSIKTRASRRKP